MAKSLMLSTAYMTADHEPARTKSELIRMQEQIKQGTRPTFDKGEIDRLLLQKRQWDRAGGDLDTPRGRVYLILFLLLWLPVLICIVGNLLIHLYT
jgi:hypothetical protein